MVKKKGSSKRWLQEHFDDHYVKRAQQEGYRSRACYKLLELQERDQLIRPGMTVIDLGSAPGSWSQVAASLVGDKGRVIASDILQMDSLAGVEFIQGDFTEQTVFDEIMRVVGDCRIDLVISDIAPNMSGMAAIDQPRSMYLAELVLDMACRTLKPGGALLMKVFQGEGFEALLKEMRNHFESVQSRKPKASRPKSREVYQLAKGYKLLNQ